MVRREFDDFFNDLYQKTQQEILRYIIAKCGNTEEISDIFQETFLEVVKIMKKKGIAYFGDKPEAIVQTIAKRKVYRHYSLRQKLGIGSEHFVQIEDVETELAEEMEFDIADSISNRELLEEVRALVKESDLLTQKILYLHFYLGENLRTVAELLQMPESSVKTKLYRSVRRMKKRLQEKGYC